MIRPKDTNNKTFAKLPTEIEEAFVREFNETFDEKSKIGNFMCEIRVYRTEIVLRVGYSITGEIRQINFDLSKQIELEDPNPSKDLENSVAGAKELFHRYFKTTNTEDFSPVWASFLNTDIYYKMDGTNTKLESEANRLLGDPQTYEYEEESTNTTSESSKDKMIHGDFSELEDIENIVEILKKTNNENI